MATNIIAKDVDVFFTSLDDHLKTVRRLILTFPFSYQLGQRKAFVRDDNIIKSYLLKCNCGLDFLNNEGNVHLSFAALSK